MTKSKRGPKPLVDCTTQSLEQYRDRIIRFLRHQVPTAAVDDLAQETLLAAHARVSDGVALANPVAFLFETASRIVGERYADQDIVAESSERTAVSELEFEAMCIAIARLPEKCRKAFVLRKVYQYTYEEIAEYCGVSVATAKSHVKRGFALLQDYYRQAGDPESG